MHKLIDKLMWGSDRPMLLGEGNGKFGDYESQLKAFVDMLDIGSVGIRSYRNPIDIFEKISNQGADSFPNQATWVEKLTSTNPHKFLFGQ